MSKKKIVKEQATEQEVSATGDNHADSEVVADEIISPEIILNPDEIGENLPVPIVDEELAVEESDKTDVVNYDPLQSYLAEIKNLPALTKEEEHELAVKYFKFKDQKAGYKLVMANLRLVVMVVREYQRNVQNILDLVQEGNIGLLEAVKQFDPYRGIRFPTYAVYWVRAYVLRYLINNIRLVKVGTTQAQRKLFFNLQKEKEKLEAEGFAPEAKLLAERLNVKESEVIEMEQRLSLPDLSVDAKVKGDEDSGDLHGLIADGKANAEDLVVREQYSAMIRESVEKFKQNLSEKEKAIIDLRLMTDEPITLQEIADKHGLSRERIRQLETRLKEQLKVFLAKELDVSEDEIAEGGEY